MQPSANTMPWLNYAVWLFLIVLVLGLRIRRMSGGSRLRLETLWIAPVILLAGVIATFMAMPPSFSALIWSVLALLIGAGIGWYRGTMMKITVDPGTHKLSQKASPWANFLLVALLVFVLPFAPNLQKALAGSLLRRLS